MYVHVNICCNSNINFKSNRQNKFILLRLHLRILNFYVRFKYLCAYISYVEKSVQCQCVIKELTVRIKHKSKEYALIYIFVY